MYNGDIQDHESVLLENFGDLSCFLSMFWDLSRYFGDAVCGVMAYSVGRILGERLYKLAVKAGVEDLRSANDFLVHAVKALKLAKDAAVFMSRSEDGALELFFRVSSSAQICGKNSRPFFFIIRGVLFQFYTLLTSKMITIASLDLSDMLNDCYEYVVKLSQSSPQPRFGKEVTTDGG